MGFKYRAKQSCHETFSEKEPQLAPECVTTEMRIESTYQQSRENALLLRKDKHPRSILSPPEITIEEYILFKNKVTCNSNLPRVQANQATDDSTIPANLTIPAQDEAYSYLFQSLSGKCHGLNLVTYPASATGDEDVMDKNGASSFIASSSTCVRIGAVVYVKPGTACRDWKDIEMGLERIFKHAAAKNGNNATAWQFEGVAFEVWEAT
ncbi:hypothetical protein UA08_03357 [Talaromyces atroroseus]|uniref:Uncharacterized protein n=1 Tax=Talaromyces atroroseus TaxID=1441469 RepID=A0A225B253_TALAT|nr:hypothetical protein UA08_03357 [Talaromyces atroroseus]OKL61316.1 hypothetical protein UA08_03357 [Talaromyces atroroseus]